MAVKEIGLNCHRDYLTCGSVPDVEEGGSWGEFAWSFFPIAFNFPAVAAARACSAR